MPRNRPPRPPAIGRDAFADALDAWPATFRFGPTEGGGQSRYGDLVWLEADAGNLTGARAGYRGLVMALDTGSAIRGPVRADLYMGRGEAAGAEAGSVRHPLRMWRLVPR